MGFIVKILLLTGVELAAAEVSDIHHSAPTEHFCTDIMHALQIDDNAIQSTDKTHVGLRILFKKESRML